MFKLNIPNSRLSCWRVYALPLHLRDETEREIGPLRSVWQNVHSDTYAVIRTEGISRLYGFSQRLSPLPPYSGRQPTLTKASVLDVEVPRAFGLF